MATEKDGEPLPTEVSPPETEVDPDPYGRRNERLDRQEPSHDSMQAVSACDERPTIGQRLSGRYRIERELGEGGMGVVYLATDEQIAGEIFAIKVLKESLGPEALELLREEVRKTRKLSHPNIVNVHSVNVDSQRVYVLMEYLEGKPLDELLDEEFGRGIPFSHAWPIIEDVGAALGYAHDHNIIHSDLKPANVFITTSGRTKLLDFGIARVSRGPLLHKRSGPLALTPAYASCEMLQGKEADPRDDLYSFACVIYEMLCGKRVFGDLDALAARERDARMPPLEVLTLKQNAELAQALTFDRERRTVSVEKLLIGLGGSAAAAWAVGSAGVPDKPSIVVVPFVNLSGDPAQGYFSDGITEDLITELSRWRRLAVRSRSASFRYSGIPVDVKQIAHELNVRFVVEGSVRRIGESIRISVQLVDAETGSDIWVEKFDCGLEEIFAVQDRVLQTIVGTLVGRVEVSATESAGRRPPTSLAAYECVLKGNALSWDEPIGAAEATGLFEKAIELDPGYARAHTLLAVMFCRQWRYQGGQPDSVLEKAYVLARRAVELDDGESTCHAILGHVCMLRRQYDLAMQYIRRAVEINPNNQWTTADVGSCLVYTGDSEEALTWFAKARELDPYFNQPWYWHEAGIACMNLGRYADALLQFGRASDRFYRNAALTAACHARMGDVARARVSVAACLSLRPDFSIAQFMSREPFKNAADAEQLASSMRLAGLPD